MDHDKIREVFLEYVVHDNNKWRKMNSSLVPCLSVSVGSNVGITCHLGPGLRFVGLRSQSVS